jgi:hypothetical protein
MRGLLVLILCCLHFIAPTTSHATIVSDQQTYTTMQTSGNDLQTACLEHQQFAEMSLASNLTFTNTQVRSLPIIKHFLPALSIVRPYGRRACIQHKERYLYPKPIGLILIFPQHYYW